MFKLNHPVIDNLISFQTTNADAMLFLLKIGYRIMVRHRKTNKIIMFAYNDLYPNIHISDFKNLIKDCSYYYGTKLPIHIFSVYA